MILVFLFVRWNLLGFLRCSSCGQRDSSLGFGPEPNWQNSRSEKKHIKIKRQRGHRSVNLDKSLGVIANHALILEEGHDGILLTNEGRERPPASIVLGPCCTLRPVKLSITHTHIHRDKEDNQETSLRTEIALCHRLSPSQWDPSYSGVWHQWPV